MQQDSLLQGVAWLFRWGDESRCIVLRQVPNAVGNLFVARKGRKIFQLVVVGVAFDRGDEFKTLLTPVLQRLETYSP